MTTIERVMEGLELRDPRRPDPRPLDFAVWNDTNTLLLLADWWTTDWGVGTGIEVVPAPLREEFLDFNLSDAVTDTEAQVHLGAASDETYQLVMDRARRRTDLDRASYLVQLQALVTFEPSFDYGPWLTAIAERPAVDAVADARARSAQMREIGRIRLLDESGTPVDALAIDEHGQAAVTIGDGWLALFADQWSGYDLDDRPAVGTFLDWLKKTQVPYGPLEVGDPELLTDAGELEQYALSATGRAPSI